MLSVGSIVKGNAAACKLVFYRSEEQIFGAFWGDRFGVFYFQVAKNSGMAQYAI
jgi:hypothetical protein